jgi:pimeloyl-ACP methyl ester carboxylesterase
MLHYTIENWEFESTKTPLVLLHGFLEDASMWKHLNFPNTHPYIRIDLPGHGKSAHVVCDTIQEMGVHVREVLNHLTVNRFCVIGHSMGGYVALALKKMDARCDKVMLMNSNFWTDSVERAQDRRRIAEIVKVNQSHFIYEVIPNLFLDPQAHDFEVKKLIKEALKMSPEAIGKASLAMSVREDFTNFVSKNAQYFVCIQGVEDRIVTLEQMHAVTKNTQIKCIELNGVGHMAHIEAKEKVEKLIADFLK